MLSTGSETTQKAHGRSRGYNDVMRLVEEAHVAARMGYMPQAFRLLDSAYGFKSRAAA